MGHERVGFLPKTKKWNTIVEGIGSFATDPDAIVEIAAATTKNVRSRFKIIGSDEGVVSAFKYLVLLSFATKQENSIDFLNEKGILLSKDFDFFDLGITAKQYLEKHLETKEYSTLATQSLMDTISDWFQKNESQQTSLFNSPENPLEKWKKASTGEGFCELSRSFFSNFTRRYLEYFLEREAAWSLKNVEERKRFKNKLSELVSDISVHAFETAKITESFSAGWFNKNVRDKIPSDKKIQGFVDYAFNKINSELLREENRE
jgi:hypothetical protein